MTVDEIIEENPWMRCVRDHISQQCPDCAVGLDQFHSDNCDVSRCANCDNQRIDCGCPKETVTNTKWTGLLYPDLHKIAIENGLWCRALIVQKDGSMMPVVTEEDRKLFFQINMRQDRQNRDVRHHVPCLATDPGAYLDLNKAMAVRHRTFT